MFQLATIAWPVLAFFALGPRRTSPAVLDAAVVPIALSVAAMWQGIFDVLSGTAKNAPLLLPFEPARRHLLWGVTSALSVLALAALRRHWPRLDRIAIALAVAAALLLVAGLSDPIDWIPLREWLWRLPIILALVVALAACGDMMRGHGRS